MFFLLLRAKCEASVALVLRSSRVFVFSFYSFKYIFVNLKLASVAFHYYLLLELKFT